MNIAPYALSTALFLVASEQAAADQISGKFLDGTSYHGQYEIEQVTASDGERVKRVSLELKPDGAGAPMRYSYDASDYPVVKSNPLGFIAIVTNVRGMEGSVNVNYVFSRQGKLASAGEIDVAQDKGQAASVEVVEAGASLNGTARDEVIDQVFKSPAAAVLAKDDVFVNAGLVFLSSKGSAVFDPTGPGHQTLLQMPSLLRQQANDGYASKLSALLGQASRGAKVEGTDRYIVSDRSYIYAQPADANKTKAYLVKNDKVVLTGASQGGYKAFSYTTAKGKQLNGWIHCEDVDACH